MEVAPINRLLPAEILEKVFRLLPPRALKMVVLVCRRWRQVGEVPWLWSWLCLEVEESSLAIMPMVLHTDRLQAVNKLRVRAVSEELLLSLAGHQGLRELDISDTKLYGMSPELVGEAVQNLVTLHIWENHITTEQAESVLRCCCSLLYLDLSYNDLSLVQPALLTARLAHLHTLKLMGTQLTPAQVESIFLAMDLATSPLRSLHLSYNSLASVEPGLLARTVARLESLAAMYCPMTVEQLQILFLTLSLGGCSLLSLDVSFSNLSSLEPGLLAEAVNKLQTVVITSTRLTGEQVTAILTQSLEQTSLKQLQLDYKRCGVDEDIVTQARNIYDLA